MLVKQTAEYKFESRRSPVISQAGIVAASQPLAVAAGLEILARGGNAADAAVACAAALSVTEPGSTGLGGDCFALYYDASTRQVSALNGSGRAPASLSLERLSNEGLVKPGPSPVLPPFHPYTITVPGACAGWCDLVERFGRLTMDAILAPAIRLAEKGFPVTPVTSYFWRQAARERLGQTPDGKELTIDGRGPLPGELFRNPGLGQVLQKIATGGKKVFYQGEIAQAIVEAVRTAGGCLSEADLAGHTSTWDLPIHINYRGINVWECPPNSQGLAALIGLNILEGFEVGSLPALSTIRLHLEIESMRLAFADARAYTADPAFQPSPLDGLLSKDYAARRRKLVNPRKAGIDYARGEPALSSDTVYLSVVDGESNACSFINSNYMGFGTGIVPAGLGFSLQNRGHNFSLDPAHPNVLAPGKRPYHTLIPGMATRAGDDTLYACFGVMGGFMQPQGHLQVIVALVDDGVDPQSALDRPRFCISSGIPAGDVAVEEGIPTEVLNGLKELGQRVFPVGGFERSIFGRGQIIQRETRSGILWAGSDPRADGCAMSLV
jgi:gamma-glutamyltranspeptidase/glutathione hydrolase